MSDAEVSRRRGKLLSLSTKIGNLVDEPDQQSNSIAQLDTAPPEFLEAFNRHFQNFNLENIEAKRATAVRLRNRIASGRKNANKAFISIGTALLQAEEEGVFTPAEFEHLLSGGPQLILMAKQQASMLRRVAKAIREGIMPMDRVPEGYSVAYQCLLLRDQNPTQFQRALDTGLIRPETSRREIIALREEHGEDKPPLNSQHRDELLMREQALVRQETRLSTQLRACRDQLRDVRNTIQALDVTT